MSEALQPNQRRMLLQSPKLLSFSAIYDPETSMFEMVVEIDIPTEERFIKVNMEMGQNVHSARFVYNAIAALEMAHTTIEHYVTTSKDN